MQYIGAYKVVNTGSYILLGGVRALSTGDSTGEMMLLWPAPGGKRILINGDTIYGQSLPGGFDGDHEHFGMQVGGIRLRMEGRVDAEEMRRRFGRVLDLEFDVILNGHNPKPLD